MTFCFILHSLSIFLQDFDIFVILFNLVLFKADLGVLLDLLALRFLSHLLLKQGLDHLLLLLLLLE